jgi:hypothetical protein
MELPSLEKQYAWRREEFVESARSLLEYLRTPVDDSGDAGPKEDDLEAFSNLDDLESWVPTLYDALTAGDKTDRLMEKLEPAWHQFKTALPFSEAERAWLLHDKTATLIGYDGSEPQDATIMSAGRYQVVRGAELMQRWLAWRREADQFHEQGAIDMARTALNQMIEVVR